MSALLHPRFIHASIFHRLGSPGRIICSRSLVLDLHCTTPAAIFSPRFFAACKSAFRHSHKVCDCGYSISAYSFDVHFTAPFHYDIAAFTSCLFPCSDAINRNQSRTFILTSRWKPMSSYVISCCSTSRPLPSKNISPNGKSPAICSITVLKMTPSTFGISAWKSMPFDQFLCR